MLSYSFLSCYPGKLRFASVGQVCTIVRTMIRTMAIKFVQCSYNALIKFVQYCTNFFAIVRTLLPLYEYTPEMNWRTILWPRALKKVETILREGPGSFGVNDLAECTGAELFLCFLKSSEQNCS